MKRLRILHLDAGRSWRGGQRQVLLLIEGLRARGHEPLLVGQPESPITTRARGAGLAVAAIPMKSDWDLRAARRIRARLRTWRPDILHAHDARSHALALIALAGRTRIPLVVTRRVPFTPRSVRLKYGPRVARFIAISNAVRHAMVAAGIEPSRIDVVHSGVAAHTSKVTPRDWRAELGWPGDSVLCGIVGAMTKEKGVDLLDAIADELPGPVRERAKVILLGGASLSRDSSGATGREPRPPIEVHRAGFVTDIDPAVAGLDVLWHPSRAEGLGTAVIDAMSLGVPPVAFATGGIPEVIEDGVSGLLAPAGDVRAFASAAAMLIEDETLRSRLADGARLRALRFDAGTMTERTEAVYYRVLAG